MAGNTKVNYDEMQGIIKLFQNSAEEMKMLTSSTKSKTEALHNNQWVGQGADQFFSEMEGSILPKMNKLIHALETASRVATAICNIIHQADEETKGFFGNLG